MIDFATSNRRRPRSAASALVLAGKRWGGAYVVENLSSSGALLRGEGELAVGEGVRVLLRLCPETTVSLTAQVTTADKHALAVAFRDVPATTRQSLEQYIRESLEAAKGASTPRILVVDDCLEICRALSRDLRSFGRDVVSAGTLQEAKAQVEAIEAPLDAAIVDFSLGAADGLLLLDVIAESHPNARRVLMSGYLSPVQLERALSTRRAHAILKKPWSKESLCRALAAGTWHSRARR